MNPAVDWRPRIPADAPRRNAVRDRILERTFYIKYQLSWSNCGQEGEKGGSYPSVVLDRLRNQRVNKVRDFLFRSRHCFALRTVDTNRDPCGALGPVLLGWCCTLS